MLEQPSTADQGTAQGIAEPARVLPQPASQPGAAAVAEAGEASATVGTAPDQAPVQAPDQASGPAFGEAGAPAPSPPAVGDVSGTALVSAGVPDQAPDQAPACREAHLSAPADVAPHGALELPMQASSDLDPALDPVAQTMDPPAPEAELGALPEAVGDAALSWVIPPESECGPEARASGEASVLYSDWRAVQAIGRIDRGADQNEGLKGTVGEAPQPSVQGSGEAAPEFAEGLGEHGAGQGIAGGAAGPAAAEEPVAVP